MKHIKIYRRTQIYNFDNNLSVFILNLFSFWHILCILSLEVVNRTKGDNYITLHSLEISKLYNFNFLDHFFTIIPFSVIQIFKYFLT